MTQPTDTLDLLAFEFFKTFARFEYALKATGYHTGEGDAHPDWNRFAKTLDALFVEKHAGGLDEAIRYLQENPPKKQVIADGKLVWKEVSDNSPPAKKLLLSIRRVRNNLFHGGKFNGHWFAPERSERLLNSSLHVLEACLLASSDRNVREAFMSEN